LQYVPQMYGRWGIAWQVAGILKALKKEFRSKIAVTLHEFIWSWSIDPRDIFLAAATRLQTKSILSCLDASITTCSRYKNILQKFSPHSLPITVIPVGANVEPVVIPAGELAAQRAKVFPENSIVFGLFSRLSAFRNFPLAVRVLYKARAEGLDAWLYLIGSVQESNPVLFKDLMRLAEELKVRQYIAISGELSKEELSVQLRMVDIFVFPQTDGISIRNTALMSAMAYGLPVVSFKPQPGNFDDYCIPCAALAERGDEEGFIESAVSCLKEIGNLRKTAPANSDYYYRNFSWPLIARNYIEALKI
jgi:glycosyltransferase involved in cell wall biosynthesis